MHMQENEVQWESRDRRWQNRLCCIIGQVEDYGRSWWPNPQEGKETGDRWGSCKFHFRVLPYVKNSMRRKKKTAQQTKFFLFFFLKRTFPLLSWLSAWIMENGMERIFSLLWVVSRGVVHFATPFPPHSLHTWQHLPTLIPCFPFSPPLLLKFRLQFHWDKGPFWRFCSFVNYLAP